MKYYAVVGLGYVGLGLAIALSKHYKVIGYDYNEMRIATLKENLDSNKLVDSAILAQSTLVYTNKLEDIKYANCYIIAVSTPAYFYETPNLEPLIAAVTQIGAILKQGDLVILESTVYPGTTEEICVPILEKISGFKNGQDFFVGYSPERVNPGDEEHLLSNSTKIIGANDAQTLAIMQVTYAPICGSVYAVSSIATAEAVKILENTQRDVNIALMNEFTKIMHTLNLNTHEIIAAAKTKWNFLPFKPGFVGGHCISIDPHYLAFKAKRHSISPDLILTARKINDGMTQFVMQSMLKLLIKNNLDTRNLTIGVLGVAYKENINDLRNSLALKLIKELHAEGFNCVAHDPLDYTATKHKPLWPLQEINDLQQLSVIILAVGHDYYRDLGLQKIAQLGSAPCVIMDLAHLFINELKNIDNVIYWSL